MKRITLLIVLVTATAVGLAPAVSADSPHFKHGGSPTCTVTQTSGSSSSTTCRASLAGLGNTDLVVTTMLDGYATYTCTNQGGNAAPGQKKVPVGPSTSTTTVPAQQIKNGTVTFVTDPAVLAAPSQVSGTAAGCPNNHWSGTDPRTVVTGVTLTIAQDGETLFTCTASNPNGLSGTVALAC